MPVPLSTAVCAQLMIHPSLHRGRPCRLPRSKPPSGWQSSINIALAAFERFIGTGSKSGGSCHRPVLLADPRRPSSPSSSGLPVSPCNCTRSPVWTSVQDSSPTLPRPESFERRVRTARQVLVLSCPWYPSGKDWHLPEGAPVRAGQTPRLQPT